MSESAAAPRLGASYYKLFTGTIISNLGDGIGMVAYPWLASAITRNPLLIAIIPLAQRLPWLIFTLPAGVITDRVDRRRAMIAMDVLRGALTVMVALAVFGAQGRLPAPDALDSVTGTNTGLYLVVLAATFLLGMAEVLRDNANQTILPQLVDAQLLEKANGRIWSVEQLMNTFVGPPLGSLLLVVAFALPFAVDAATFFAAAGLVALIPGTFRSASVPSGDNSPERAGFRTELAEGVRWLMSHPLLRPLAIILGLLNASYMVNYSTFVLFAQDVMGIGPALFAIIGWGAAIGGAVAGVVAPRVSQRFGGGTIIAATLVLMSLTTLLGGLFPYWPVVIIVFAIHSGMGMVWNVVTVSLRQEIIPDHLLGRVNSVYRFFAWGMMPLGAAFGGALVWIAEPLVGHHWALRSTWFASAAIVFALFIVGRRTLTTDKITAARHAAATQAS
ncbi:MAG: MFS transporter [Ilumatobacter coccineus]|uniref:MFS transporter n=1 Tax=Ilumatobacter coccineus TaxID=467094 RepID=A0A2G6KDE2_9ACTN|nr:MAG: MFS transporter [Ilumatobacter coccineus]